MKKLMAVLLALTVLLGSAACSLAEGEASLFDLFTARDMDALYERSSPRMKEALGTADALKALWPQLEGAYGAYKSAEIAGEYEQEGSLVQVVACDFAFSRLTLMLVSSEGLLDGITVAASEPIDARSEALGAAHAEEPITLRAGADDESHGLLTLPEGEGPFPCVVLAHGSGPSDRNETCYGMQVFAELAWLLADNGVASIRYDKYTYAHPEKCAVADFTMDSEYLGDVKEAFAIADADERISGVFLAGHSLGAHLAPRLISQIESPKLRGGVLISGMPSDLWSIMTRQYGDALIMGEQSEESAAAMRAAIEDGQRIMDKAASLGKDEAAGMTIMGIPAWYYVDDAQHDIPAELIATGLPYLIVQGEKDFQVLMSEGVEAWRAALDGADNVTIRSYPKLTHLLFELEGEPTGTADYAGEHHVDAGFAADIAEWIKGVMAQ